jgi:hypothetical protein
MSIFVYPTQSLPKAEFFISECSTFCIILCWNQSGSRYNAFLAKEEQNKNVWYFYVATQRTKWQWWFTLKVLELVQTPTKSISCTNVSQVSHYSHVSAKEKYVRLCKSTWRSIYT